MVDIVGQKFSKLTVIEKTNERHADGSVLYLSKCAELLSIVGPDTPK